MSYPKEFRSQLRKRLHGENGEVSSVKVRSGSIIIDKSTDKATRKWRPSLFKLFDEAAMRVDTRLINLVPVQGQITADLFETDLAKNDVQITQLV